MPCWIQNSSSRVRPETARSPSAVPIQSDVAAPAGIRDDSTDHRNASAHGSDDVADPVDEVKERAFRLRSGLTLYRDICLRRGAKVLSESHGPADHQKADCDHHGCYTYVLHLRVDLHRDSALVVSGPPERREAADQNSGLGRMLGRNP